MGRISYSIKGRREDKTSRPQKDDAVASVGSTKL
jgi:hypothetical protein